MTTITVSPDSYSFRFGASVSGSGLVGTWPVLTDADDATYLEVAADFSIPNGDEADLLFSTPAGSGTGTQADVTAVLRMMVDAGDEALVNESRVQVNVSSSTGDYHAVWLFSLPDPTRWYDAGLPLGTPLGGGAGSEHVYGDDAPDHWVRFTNKTSPDFDTDGTDSDDPFPGMLAEIAAGTLVVSITRPQSAGGVDTGAHRNVRVSEFTLTVPSGGIELPCDEWVNPDLSTATQLGTSDGDPFGQYSDGVIWTNGGDPDFYFPFVLDPAKALDIAVTFDPDSAHDGGGRFVRMYALRPGHEQEDLDAAYAVGLDAGGCAVLYNNGIFPVPTGDVQAFTIGPGRDRGPGVDEDDGLPGWSDATLGVTAGYTRLWMETANAGAVSQISIRKVCTDDGPTPPSDGGGDDGPNPGGGSSGATPPADPGDAPDRAIGFLNPSTRRGAPTEAEIIVDGHWLSLNGQLGGLTWSHTWPGGSANATWSAYGIPHRLTRRDLSVELAYGGQRFWAGVLDLPGGDGTMNAIGLATLGANFAALDGSGNATAIPDDAIDAAIGRGLRWKRRDSFSADAQDVDITQGPVKLSDLLDTAATDAGQRWAVDPDGYVYTAADPTVPAAHILYLDGPLTPADDDVATALIGRYRDSGGYATTDPIVAASAGWLGYSEDTIDLTGRGVITEAKAIAKLTKLLNLGRALPAWADPIQLVHGDLLTLGQVPMPLEVFRAGQVIRVHGQIDDTQQLSGRTWVDVLIGQSEVGDATLTATPISAPVVGMFDAITQALNKRKAA